MQKHQSNQNKLRQLAFSNNFIRNKHRAQAVHVITNSTSATRLNVPHSHWCPSHVYAKL